MGAAQSDGSAPLGAMDALQIQLDSLEQSLTSLEDDYTTRLAGTNYT